MEQYSYHEETGKITLEKKAVQNSENAGKSIYLMSLDEFLSHPRKLVRKNNFIHSMTPIQYCKIEKYRECVQGTMRVPKGNKGQVCIHNFWILPVRAGIISCGGKPFPDGVSE